MSETPRFLVKSIMLRDGFQCLYRDYYNDFSGVEKVRTFETLAEVQDWLEARTAELMGDSIPQLPEPPREAVEIPRTGDFLRKLGCGHGVPRVVGNRYRQLCDECEERWKVQCENLRRSMIKRFWRK